MTGPNESRRKSRDKVVESPQLLTRSKTSPYNKNVCFFCDGSPGYRQTLHNVITFSAGESLRTAVGLSGNNKLLVKLSTTIAENDAHAVDIKYHKQCWANNVTNILRKSAPTAASSISLTSEIAAKIEFITMTEITLREGKIVTMTELQSAYEDILEANNVTHPAVTRKQLKLLLQNEIQGIEFHKPKRVNKPERVSIKKTRDGAIQLFEENMPADQSVDEIDETEVKTLFDAALLLRNFIKKCKKWKITGSLGNISDEHVPT